MFDDIQQKVKELSLLLMWLTSWKNENMYEEYQEPKEESFHFTKEYAFGILDKLKTEKMIVGSYKSKSLILTEKGVKEAKKLEKKFFLNPIETDRQLGIGEKENFGRTRNGNLDIINY